MKKKFIQLFLGFSIFFFSIKATSQTAGDYRSKNPAGGNWNAVASWERFDGTNWVNAVATPTSADGIITVRNGHTITINTNSFSGDQIVVEAGGTLEMAPGAGVNFSLNNGAGDDITVNGTMTWSGGNIFSSAGTASILIASGATLTNTTSAARSFDVALTIATGGTMNWNDGNISMSGSITNNGTLNIAGNNSLTTPSLQPVDNNGTITKTSSGTTTSGARINNNGGGIINLNSGTISSSTLYTYSNSTFNFSGGAVFNNIAQFNYNGGTIQGSGSFNNSINSVLTINTSLEFSSGVIFTDNSGTGINGIQGSGNLTINNDFVINSNINGSGSLTVNGNIDWQNSSLFRSLNISAGRTLTLITSATKDLSAAALTIAANGILNWNNGLFRLSTNASITNNGAMNIAGNNELLDNSGTCFLVNNNMISKSSTGTSTFSTADITNSSTGIIKGLGTIDFNTPINRYHNNGTIAPGLSPGILTVNSSLNLISPFSANSTLSIEVAGNAGAGQPNGHDQMQRAGNLTLNGTLTVTETGAVPGGDYIIISVTSGTITGTFATANLPAFYSVIYNSNNVIVRKEGFNTYYHDVDVDGFGNPNDIIQAGSPPAGYITDNTDCNDNNAAVHPGATEVCNGIDDDCDGLVDEGVQTTFYSDNDGDGYGNASQTTQACTAPAGYVSNSTDCNDGNPAIHPGATEICNGIDDDCDGLVDENPTTTYYQDLDGDTYGNPAVTVLACTPPPGYVAIGGDCNDQNIAVHPNAIEVCNGIDDDCDGQVDEGLAVDNFYRDTDGDGYGDPNAEPVITACAPPPGYVGNNLDCNDNNPAIHPNATEICNGVDDDCDGLIDEGFDQDGDGYTGCEGDCNNNDNTVYPGATEVCDSKDNDCDGLIDEGVIITFYYDADHDGFGNVNSGTLQGCYAPPWYVTTNTDCNDNDITIYPGAPELCDAKDNDCDEQVDEGLQLFNWYPDADGDGYGFPQNPVLACAAPSGYVGINQGFPPDCNDNNPAIHPNATEICNGVDDNCNGQIDEGVLLTWLPDADGDGYGLYLGNNIVNACSAPSGYVLFSLPAHPQDCNDNNPAVHPFATEICNGIDDDCDGQIDEGFQTFNWLPDADGDGYGRPQNLVTACSAPTGYVLFSLPANPPDCNDNNPAIHPFAIEICNGVDDDCDGQIDEGLQTFNWLPDADGDGYGRPQNLVTACSAPTGYVLFSLPANPPDCNDNNPAIHPFAIEICNGVDDDCDGQIDEGLQTFNWLPDADGDGYGRPQNLVTACSAPTGYVLFSLPANPPDCNDNNPAIHPFATEICNGIDDDCDGQIDEGAAPLQATITPGGIISICSGTTVTLSANTGTGFTYKWYKNASVISGQTSSSLVVNSAGVYYVRIDAGNCFAISLPVAVIIIPLPPAFITVTGSLNICQTGSVQLAANPGIFPYTYQWKRNGATIAGATQRIYIATQTGSYTVTVTRLGCSTTSSPVSVINSCARMTTENRNEEEQEEIIQSFKSAAGLRVYPNPASNQFFVEMNFNDDITGEAMVQLSNALGKQVFLKKATVVKGKLLIPVQLGSQYADGLYIVRVRFNNKEYITRLVKIKAP